MSVNRRTNDVMVVGRGGYVRVSVQNESLLATGDFDLDLYFDGLKVETWELGSLPGRYLFIPGSRDIIPELDPRKGLHTLKMVIDPKNEVEETNEDDNIFETTVEWHVFEPDPAPAITFSEDELQEAFAELQPLLRRSEPMLADGGTNIDPQIAVAMADAGYYLITGKSIRDEPVVIEMLGDAAYRQRVTELFAGDFATSPTHLYPSILARQERFKTEVIGFTASHLGRVLVVINSERSFDEVLTTLAHEFGHVRQRIESPRQGDAPGSHALRGLFEAQAYLFQRVFWLTLEEQLRERLLSYPAQRFYQDDIDFSLQSFESGARTNEHDLGRLLMWGVLFTDGAVAGLAESVTANGSLDATETLELYNHLTAKDVTFIDLYVDSRFEEFDALVERIRSLAYSRLVPGLALDLEGTPGLRQLALLFP